MNRFWLLASQCSYQTVHQNNRERRTHLLFLTRPWHDVLRSNKDSSMSACWRGTLCSVLMMCLFVWICGWIRDLSCGLIRMCLFNHICDVVERGRKCSALVLWNIQVNRWSWKWGRPILLDEHFLFFRKHNILDFFCHDWVSMSQMWLLVHYSFSLSHGWLMS